MNRGYVKVWRKTLDSGLLQYPEAWALFCWCLLNATRKPITHSIRGKQVRLKPGQLLFSQRKVAEELEMGRQQIRTALAFLIKAEILTQYVTHLYTIITIVNWHTYQSGQNETNPVSNPVLTQYLAETYARQGSARGHKNIYICKHFSVTAKQHEVYQEAYPALDLVGEYKKMAAWLESNPKKRKTPRGYPRFINNWLSKAHKEGKDSSDWRDSLKPL